MKLKHIYDRKIIILDINFLEIKKLDLDNFLAVKKLINHLSANQNLILLTNNSFHGIEKIVDNLNIKSGYLVTDSGSNVVNISTKKTIIEAILDKETLFLIAKKCIWKNLNFLINTKNNGCFIYSINYWLIPKYKTDLSKIYECKNESLKNLDDLKKCIEENDAYGIEIYFLGNNEKQIENKMKSFIYSTLLEDRVNYYMNESILYLFSNTVSKYNAVKYLEKLINLKIETNALYFALDQYYPELSKSVYFSLVPDKIHNKLKKRNNFSATDIVKASNNEWINWFYNNAHLWTENVEEHLNNLLSKIEKIKVFEYEIEKFKEKNFKYLNIDLDNAELYKSWIVYKQKMFYLLIKRYIVQQQNTLKILFWPEYKHVMINYLSENKLLIKSEVKTPNAAKIDEQ